nr:TOBE-like domain-containing protein [Nocardioides convexus]
MTTAPGAPGALAGTITRALRVGFEVRLTVDVEGQAEPALVVLSRTHARALDLDAGARVWLRPTTGATSVPVLGAASA